MLARDLFTYREAAGFEQNAIDEQFRPRGQWHDPATDKTDLRLWTRDHEVQLRILSTDAGLCKHCGEPLVYAEFAWDHRITDPMYRPGPWQLGEDAFRLSRHANGT